MKSLFIFGAGASRSAGGPLMTDFLDYAFDVAVRDRGELKGAWEDFDQVFSAIAGMRTVHAKSYLDLDNIEVLFGAIEMGGLIGKMASLEAEGIRNLRNSIVSVIVNTLQYSIRFPVDGDQILAPRPYAALVNALRELSATGAHRDPHSFSFISFNYDVALDLAVQRDLDSERSYCLHKSDDPAYPCLKLHGSLNWGVCQKCQAVIPAPLPVCGVKPGHPDHIHLPLAGELDRMRHCEKPLRRLPLIVPPTWNKTQHHEQIAPVWRRAAQEISEAENIFIIGYSLPATDSFFRYLFALGADSATRVRQFWVIDPDETGDVEKRVRQLIGPGIQPRRVRFLRRGFEAAIPDIKDALAPSSG